MDNYKPILRGQAQTLVSQLAYERKKAMDTNRKWNKRLVNLGIKRNPSLKKLDYL